MSKGLLRRIVLVGALVAGIAATPAILFAGYVGYLKYVPRYSAVANFEDSGFNLRLDFYLTENPERDSGRYLTVITTRYETIMLPGGDWAHRARTNVYRIDSNHIAVLSPLGYDYKINLKPLEFSPVVSDRGDQWQYLGAFDFVFPENGRPWLNFFDTQLVECIPMGADDETAWRDKARPAARHARCPAP